MKITRGDKIKDERIMDFVVFKSSDRCSYRLVPKHAQSDANAEWGYPLV